MISIMKSKMENNRLENRKVAREGKSVVNVFRQKALKKEPGIDGILVTVGLCIIALLLCVVMKDSMAKFIETIVTTLTSEAQKILTGVTGGIIL